jgi:hypothetical protein
MALWILPKRGLLCVGAKANVPLCGGKKLNKKMCGGEKKKYRRVGKVCLTFCGFKKLAISEHKTVCQH